MAHLLHAEHPLSTKQLTVGVVVAWFMLALVGSLLGVFDSQTRPPVMLGLAVVVPTLIFELCYFEFVGFRQFVLSLDLRLLTLAQIWPVAGFTFLVLYFRGLLPGVFALPAGWGDIAIGITALLVAWCWRRPFPYTSFVVWNVLGLLDLVTAVSLGILASGSPVGLLARDVTTRLMGLFPLSLIPTFFVPLFIIFHLISLRRAARRLP